MSLKALSSYATSIVHRLKAKWLQAREKRRIERIKERPPV